MLRRDQFDKILAGYAPDDQKKLTHLRDLTKCLSSSVTAREVAHKVLCEHLKRCRLQGRKTVREVLTSEAL